MTMNDKERLTLQNFHTRLIKDLMINENFLGQFLQEGLLDFDLIEEIRSETTDSAKNAKFLSILPRRGPKAFTVLLQVLERTSPWIKDDLETFYNKQKRIHYKGDVDALFASSPDAQSSCDDTSPKTLCTASVDIAIQTDSDVEEDGVKLTPGEVFTLNDIYLRLVTYLHSQGHKEFEIAVASEPDLLKRVVSEILRCASTKDYKLTQIMDMFNEYEKEMAQNEVCNLVQTVISEIASLKEYRDNKDLEVMKLEKEYNETIEHLQSQITDLKGDVEEGHNQMAQLKEELSEKKTLIQRMEEAEKERQQEPLLKRMHNLIEEVTEAKSQKEKQMYETGQEYQDLVEETKCIEDLLYQLKDVHDYHATHNARNGVRQVIDNRRQVFRSAGNGVTYNRNVVQRISSNDGFRGVGMSTSMTDNVQMSSRWNRGPRRRLKRSPRPQYRVSQRSNTDNAPMSPKQKTPRYQQSSNSKQFAEIQTEDRPVTRQSTNLSRQGTNLSFQSISTQSTGYLTNRQNSVARPTSSRQSQISLDLPLSARNRQNSYVRNGTNLSFRSETDSPLPSARQTPCESHQLLFNITHGSGNNRNGRNNQQIQFKDLRSMR